MTSGRRALTSGMISMCLAACGSKEAPATCEAAMRRLRTMELDMMKLSADETKARMDSWLPRAVEQRTAAAEAGDAAALRDALPLLDEAAKALRGFEAKSRVVRDVLGLSAAADAHVASDQAALEAANAQIEEAQQSVVATETAFHDGMVATGLLGR